MASQLDLINRLLVMYDDSPAKQLQALVRLAALHIDYRGKVLLLAQRAGIRNQSLLNAMYRGRMSKEMAIAIQDAVGADVMPAEKLLYLRADPNN